MLDINNLTRREEKHYKNSQDYIIGLFEGRRSNLTNIGNLQVDHCIEELQELYFDRGCNMSEDDLSYMDREIEHFEETQKCISDLIEARKEDDCEKIDLCLEKLAELHYLDTVNKK